MKKFFLLFLLISFSHFTEAQEKYIDSLYEVKAVNTKVYAEKDSEKLIIDLYEPENADTLRPMILFMHGGGFSGGSPKNPQEVKFAKMAAAKGYLVGLISYRLTRKNKSFGCDYEAAGKMETFSLAAEDFMDAAKFMKDNAEIFHIDPKKMIAGGSSAGAEGVLNAVYNPDLMFKNRQAYKDLKFSAVISLAGALADVRYLNKEESTSGIFFHGTADNLVPYATAAHHYCDPKQPGYFILDGSKTIVDKLEQLDTSFLFYSYEGAKHEISGMPFQEMPAIFHFLKKVALENEKMQSRVYR